MACLGFEEGGRAGQSIQAEFGSEKCSCDFSPRLIFFLLLSSLPLSRPSIFIFLKYKRADHPTKQCSRPSISLLVFIRSLIVGVSLSHSHLSHPLLVRSQGLVLFHSY